MYILLILRKGSLKRMKLIFYKNSFVKEEVYIVIIILAP